MLSRQLIVAQSDRAFTEFLGDTFQEAKFLSFRDHQEFQKRESDLIARMTEYFPAFDLLKEEPQFDIHDPQGCVYSLDLSVPASFLKREFFEYFCSLLVGPHTDFRIIVSFEEATSDLGHAALFHSKIIIGPTLWDAVRGEHQIFTDEEPLVVDCDSNGYRNLNEEA